VATVVGMSNSTFPKSYLINGLDRNKLWRLHDAKKIGGTFLKHIDILFIILIRFFAFHMLLSGENALLFLKNNTLNFSNYYNLIRRE